ncbi:drebrin-like protein A [Myripristis murdjan]|uniref:drebrin-like protein A n=1 Tax=Myripristis murdjan TaxID=586833 RepID=UPI001176006B|nr:drebrin-like protein A [Myripristis murdjan]XP_029921268.1 drebrin-like protein A [Myripristis murdjan]
MAVNLSKNGSALMAAYKEVIDAKADTNWALFTYEGNSNAIRLAEKGDGGLEEMVEELSSGKVMYAFCRVQDPNSGLPKYVLINWTGEGVKDSRKGICANHLSSIANFLKGAHVTINARAEEDVDPQTILTKVAKASGANFNFHKERETQEYRDVPRGPVGSVYQKTNAVEEIQRTDKDSFWAQAQRDEEVRRQEETKRAEQERQKVERERKEADQRQAAERERAARERALQIDQNKSYQKQLEAEEREREQQRLEQQHQKNSQKASIQFAASVQKAKEAESLISQRSFNPRDVFKQKEQPSGLNSGRSPATTRPGKLQSPFLSQKSQDREIPGEPEFPRPSAPVPPLAPPSPIEPTCPVPSASADRSYSPAAAASPEVPETPASPVQAADGAYQEEEYWSDEFDDDAEDATLEESPGQEEAYEAPLSPRTEEDLYEEVNMDTPAVEEHGAESSEQGVCARALYDYQAVDNTEITFDPEDIITGIEMVDEGWWRGFAPDGHYGMFPANYVELL